VLDPLPPTSLVAAFDGDSDDHPDLIARVLATTIVATLAGALATKLFGRKAGLAALLITATAHELLDAPLARRLGAFGL
jgi:hypothetical protein